MFKRSCDNCRKALKEKEDYISIQFGFEMYHFCVSCIKFIPTFLEKVMLKKSNKK